jgi:hypothetical protein
VAGAPPLAGTKAFTLAGADDSSRILEVGVAVGDGVEFHRARNARP